MRWSTLVQNTTENVRAAMEKGTEVRGVILGPSYSIAHGTRYANFMATRGRLCFLPKR